MKETFYGVLIPFLGTSLGSACVFFMKKTFSQFLQRALTGFAAGVMVAASIWSLLIPAMEESADLERLAFLPAVAGLWAGVLFLLFLDRVVPQMDCNSSEAEGAEASQCTLRRTVMLALAVTLHNLPEGMAVGAVYAGYLTGDGEISAMGALALSLGIAIQNFPEGAIISMPLRAEGMGKFRAFIYGMLSGVIEPVGAVLTILTARYAILLLPYLLSFAAGAMVYVVVKELVPEMEEGKPSNIGAVLFSAGFTVMMVLDVVLG